MVQVESIWKSISASSETDWDDAYSSQVLEGQEHSCQSLEELETDSTHSDWNTAVIPPSTTDTPTFNINTKVVAHFTQNEVDIFFCRYGMGGDISGAVCGPCNSHLLPGQEENHSAVTGGWVEQTHVFRAEKEGTWFRADQASPGSVLVHVQLLHQHLCSCAKTDHHNPTLKCISQSFWG